MKHRLATRFPTRNNQSLCLHNAGDEKPVQDAPRVRKRYGDAVRGEYGEQAVRENAATFSGRFSRRPMRMSSSVRPRRRFIVKTTVPSASTLRS